MKAVILAAGRGKRMEHLTESRPKPLLEYQGKTLLAYTLDLIPASCSEIILIVGYHGDLIREAVGESWNFIPVRYIVQTELNGTGGALWLAQECLKGEDFLVFPADDIYSKKDIDMLCKKAPSMLVTTIASGRMSAGKVETDEDGHLVSITEGTHDAPITVATAAYYINSDVFKYPLVQIPGRAEYGLPQTVVLYSIDHPVKLVHATDWKQMVTPKDIQPQYASNESHEAVRA